MNWTSGEFIVFGAESGKLYLWDATSFTSIAVIKAHHGIDPSCTETFVLYNTLQVQLQQLI